MTVAVLIVVASLWAWKVAEYLYRSSASKRRDPLGPKPWGFVVSLDLPVYATVAAPVVLGLIEFIPW